MILRFADTITDRVIEHFGITNNFAEAGYILDDGRMLNFSGGSPGMRGHDHRELDFAFPDGDTSLGAGWHGVIDFMNLGHMRFSLYQRDSVLTSFIVSPTRAQISKVAEAVKYVLQSVGKVNVYIDTFEAGGTRKGHVKREDCFTPSCWPEALAEAGVEVE